MTKLNICAGLDISKHSLDVCLLHQGQQRLHKFPYDEGGLCALARWLPEGCTCVMEATGPYYLKAALCLHQKGFLVSVVNPLVIRRYCQMRLARAKTDKADARMIASYGSTQPLALWQPPEQWLVKLGQLQALASQLQKHHSALLNQREAFSCSTLMDKEVKQSLNKAIRQAHQQILAIEASMEALMQHNRGSMLQNLETIPGVGRKTAVVLIGITAGFTKFANHKQLCAYVGLSPRIFESGTSLKGRAHICKMGMSRIRAMLYVCAWSAKRCNQGCKELYERLLQKGKSKRLALIAVAHKLLKQAFAIAVNDYCYQHNYQKNICP